MVSKSGWRDLTGLPRMAAMSTTGAQPPTDRDALDQQARAAELSVDEAAMVVLTWPPALTTVKCSCRSTMSGQSFVAVTERQ